MTSNHAGGEAPRRERYAITLATSSLPMPVKLDAALALPGISVFRSRIVEDGRDRYRLHLGYFASAEAAAAALALVRTHYPAALVAVAPELESGSLDDTLNTSFALVRGPIAELVPAAAPAKPSASEPGREPAAAAPAATLTPGQVARVMAPQRYAVQLDWSWQEPGSKPIPRLGIFRAYRLYGVSVTREGRAEHGLRLGFFKNLDGALQVADYVRDAYPCASVVPVSYREYTRASELARPAPTQTAAPAANAGGTEGGETGRDEHALLTVEERTMLLSPARRTSRT